MKLRFCLFEKSCTAIRSARLTDIRRPCFAPLRRVFVAFVESILREASADDASARRLC
jgi:hypothetical protein